MKIRISDLLDGYQVREALPLAGGDPDPERILARVKGRAAGQARRRGRPARWAAAIAALAALFTLTAAAVHLGGGSLWAGFFAQTSGQSLTEAQLALLDELSTSQLPPAVSNGITLTPLAAVSDEHTLYLRLRAEAPEGTVLPDMGEREDHVFLDVDLRDTETGEHLDWGMQKARFLPDDTPGDNVVEFVFMLYGHPGGANWNDGVSKTLYLTGLLLYPDRAQQPGDYVLLEGEWSFDLSHFYQSREIQVDTGGAERWDPESGRMVTLEELTISPLSLSLTLSYPSEENKPFVNFALAVVCRDGSTIPVDGGNGYGDFGPDGRGGTDYFYAVSTFDAPVPLDQVAYLQFGEYQIFLPQT